MTSRADFNNGGAFCRTKRIAGNKSATAGGAGDATEVTGAWIDRLPSDSGPAASAKLSIEYTATLAQGATLKFAANFQDATSNVGAGADDYGDALPATTVATGGAGGSTETGTVEIDVDLEAARQFVTAQITPDLSAANTDTCNWSAQLITFHPSRQPCSKALLSTGGLS